MSLPTALNIPTAMPITPPTPSVRVVARRTALPEELPVAAAQPAAAGGGGPRCGHCQQHGHTKQGCPTLRGADWKPVHTPEQRARWKEMARLRKEAVARGEVVTIERAPRKSKAEITCGGCGEKGHIRTSCPENGRPRAQPIHPVRVNGAGANRLEEAIDAEEYADFTQERHEMAMDELRRELDEVKMERDSLRELLEQARAALALQPPTVEAAEEEVAPAPVEVEEEVAPAPAPAEEVVEEVAPAPAPVEEAPVPVIKVKRTIAFKKKPTPVEESAAAPTEEEE